MEMTLIVIAAIAVLALVGWGIAELKNKGDQYEPNEQEIETLEKQQANETRELDIHDVIETISSKGFDAV